MIIIFALTISCVDKYESCDLWSKVGECSNNPSYMLQNCKKSCNVCNITCNEQVKYIENNFINKTVDRIKKYTNNVIFHKKEPLVVEINNFLTDVESNHIIKLCTGKFSRSQAGDGITQSRTSEQCWCQDKNCTNDDVIKKVEERISSLLNMSNENAEFMQILKYEENQYYMEHHDQNSPHNSLQGPRVFTFFMYLNTVESGGETYFPKLNLYIKPIKNKAILWNSIRGENNDEINTFHEAKPVIKGLKYAANLWFHSGKFRLLHTLGCPLKYETHYVPTTYKTEL